MPGNQDIHGLGWVLKSVQRVLLCFWEDGESVWSSGCVVVESPIGFKEKEVNWHHISFDMSWIFWCRVTNKKKGFWFHIRNSLLMTRTSICLKPFALHPQAKRRLALDDSDHQHQPEPIRTPRGKAPTPNGTRIKTPKSKQLQGFTCTYL